LSPSKLNGLVGSVRMKGYARALYGRWHEVCPGCGRLCDCEGLLHSWNPAQLFYESGVRKLYQKLQVPTWLRVSANRAVLIVP